MCIYKGVVLSCEDTVSTVGSKDELGEKLANIQRRREVRLGKKVFPVEITNGRKVLKVFISASRIIGWEKNGVRDGAYYIKGAHDITRFFGASLA